MTPIGWVLGAAVLAVVGWLLALLAGQLGRVDRQARLQAAAAQLEAAREGATAERAIAVGSPAQIEPRAEREPCPCGGRLHVEAHEAVTAGGLMLRRVVCRCGSCGSRRTTWFRVRATHAT